MTTPAPTGADLYREQVRVMAQAMPAAVSIVDAAGSVLWVNPYWTRFTGRSFEASLGDGWRTAIHPDDLSSLDEAFRQAQAAQSGFRIEVRLEMAAGAERRWTQIQGEPLVNAKGRIEGWISVSNDVHDRKLAMDELARGKARYEALTRSTAAVVFELDARGNHRVANPAWEAFTGRPFEAHNSRDWSAGIHPDDLALAQEEWTRARQAGRAAAVTLRHWHAPSAGYRWVRTNLVPLKTADGEIDEWVGTLADVDEEVRSSLAIQESEARFRLVAENAPVNLWMGDAEGRCVYLNRQQRAFWGVDESLDGFSWADTLLDEDRETLMARFSEAMRTQSAFEVEARYWRADGEVRSLRTQANPRHDADGMFLGMIGVNIDTTDARRAQLHQRLLTNELNHRVKNTLTTVQSLASQTLRAYRDVDEARGMLEGRLMALSSAHNILNRENWEAASFSEVVEEAIRVFEIGDRRRFHAEGPAARVSPQTALAVAMVLHELSTNSVKYGALSCDRGEVRVSWASTDRDTLAVHWQEVGGPPVEPPKRKGFGSRLLAGVASDFRTAPAIDYATAGVQCRFEAPLAGPATFDTPLDLAVGRS